MDDYISLIRLLKVLSEKKLSSPELKIVIEQVYNIFTKVYIETRSSTEAVKAVADFLEVEPSTIAK